MGTEKSSFTEKIVQNTVKPLLFFIFMVIPISCIALAYLQSIDYALIREELREAPDRVTSTLDYFALLLQKESNPSTWLFLVITFYIPFLLTIIVNYTKLDWKRIVKGILKKFLTSFGFTVCLMIISQFGLGVSAFSIKGLAPYIVFFGLTFAILVLLEKWSVTEIDVIGRTVLATLSSVSIILTVLFLTKLNIKPTLDSEISAGLWKDLLLISTIYVLTVSFGTWIVTKFSINVDSDISITNEKFRYSLPIMLIFLFIVVSIITLWFEVAWRDHGFVDVTRKIYNGKIDDNQIGILWALHNQHIMMRSALALFIGTVVTISFATLVKMGAYMAWTNKLKH